MVLEEGRLRSRNSIGEEFSASTGRRSVTYSFALSCSTFAVLPDRESVGRPDSQNLHGPLTLPRGNLQDCLERDSSPFPVRHSHFVHSLGVQPSLLSTSQSRCQLAQL